MIPHINSILSRLGYAKNKQYIHHSYSAPYIIVEATVDDPTKYTSQDEYIQMVIKRYELFEKSKHPTPRKLTEVVHQLRKYYPELFI